MTDKEVRKLGRKELVELLYYLSRENDELKQENKQLKERLDALVGEAIAMKKEPAQEQPSEQKHE